jgi:hypothetical protein
LGTFQTKHLDQNANRVATATGISSGNPVFFCPRYLIRLLMTSTKQSCNRTRLRMSVDQNQSNNQGIDNQ